MLVRHVLDRKGHETHAIGPEATVLEALRRMAEHEIGALLVMQGDRVLGVISERDYARKVALLGRASRDTLISQIMTAPAVTVRPQAGFRQIIAAFRRHTGRSMPVVDDDGRLAGMLLRKDFLEALDRGAHR